MPIRGNALRFLLVGDFEIWIFDFDDNHGIDRRNGEPNRAHFGTFNLHARFDGIVKKIGCDGAQIHVPNGEEHKRCCFDGQLYAVFLRGGKPAVENRIYAFHACMRNEPDAFGILFHLCKIACKRVILLILCKHRHGGNVLFEIVCHFCKVGIGVVDGFYYEYMQREGSITYTFNEKLYDMVNNFDSIFKYYKDHNLFDEYYEELEYVYVRYFLATFIKRMAKCKDKKKYLEAVDYALTKVKENFPEYKKNKYLKKSKKGLYLKYFNKMIASLIFLVEKNRQN